MWGGEGKGAQRSGISGKRRGYERDQQPPSLSKKRYNPPTSGGLRSAGGDEKDHGLVQ